MKIPIKTITILALFSLFICSCVVVQADNQPPQITIVYPTEGQQIRETQPKISIQYQDTDGIDISSIQLKVDSLDVTQFEETSINNTSITYSIPEFLSLSNGNHTVFFQVSDKVGNKAEITWKFTVNTTLPTQQPIKFDFKTIITLLIYGLILFSIGFVLYILYLKRTRKFTFKKFFAQHPIQKEIFTIYLPIIFAFLITIFGLLYILQTSNLPQFSIEYLFIIAVFIAIGPYAIESQIERRRTVQYEKAYAQLLFEIADAMRGGLDPTKAIVELAKTDTTILRKRLNIAADNIRIGRPFHEVMPAMARNIKSELVQRYATIIGETSRIGGDPAIVIHRAAKDMDDFIKLNKERRRQLMSQATIIYIGVAVLLIVLYQLIVMFPSIGNIDLGLLSQTNVENIKGTPIARMNFMEVKRQFFDLCLINGVGTGTVIGSLIDGHFKYGLIHSLILTAVSAVFFIVLII